MKRTLFAFLMLSAALTPFTAIAQSVTLQQAIAIATASSPTLAQARSTYQIAKAGVLVAGIPMQPSLSVQGQYATQTNSANTTTSTGIALSQLIFDGGRTIAQIQSAKGVSAAAANTYRRSLETLAFNVAQAYYLDLMARAKVQLQLRVVDQYLRQEQLIEAQIEAGTAAQVDLKTAQIPTTQARVAAVLAQGDALSANARFAVTLGLPAASDVSPSADNLNSSTLPIGITLDYDRALARARALRPDALAAESIVASAEASLRAARRYGTPTIDISAIAGSTTSGTGAQWKPNSSAVASLNFPLYDQGLTRANVALAQGQLEQAVATENATELNIQLDVRQGLVNLSSAQKANAQTLDELAKATALLSATREQYRAGQATLLLLLNAQNQSVQAQNDVLSSRYNLRQLEQAYLFALGENGPPRTSAGSR
ncbi:MAG: TolC family protein [Candidatus Eremiobacteraeota bacterium]|nr:TolC family protein [Candidatus Eremiobacteraeota bacterium]